MNFSWLTPDNLNKIVRVLMLIVSLYAGKGSIANLQQLNAQPGGVAGATQDDLQTLGGNGFISIIAMIVFAKPTKVTEFLSTFLGIEGSTTATRFATLVSLHKNFRVSGNADEKKHYRDAAVAITNDLFSDGVPTP